MPREAGPHLKHLQGLAPGRLEVGHGVNHARPEGSAAPHARRERPLRTVHRACGVRARARGPVGRKRVAALSLKRALGAQAHARATAIDLGLHATC